MRNGQGGFWQTDLGPVERRPALAGDLDVDVAIVGAGYTGLWTAYYLRRADPALRVAVLEAEHAGLRRVGAQRRLALGHGDGRSRALCPRRAAATPRSASSARRSRRSPRSSGCARRRGSTPTSCAAAPCTSRSTRRSSRACARRCATSGSGAASARTICGCSSPTSCAARIRVDGALGASFTPHCARIHPAKLARGLARAVERRGAAIYEGTRALAIGNRQVATAHGHGARRVGRLRDRGLHRATARPAALAAAARKLDDRRPSRCPTERWREIGWDGCETLLDGAHVYSYSQRTADGRIAIGGRGVPYRFGSGVDTNAECPRETAVRAAARRSSRCSPRSPTPAIEHRWSGVLGLARDWCATVTADRASGNAWAGGYVGNGVSTANLAARTLVDLMLGRESELTSLPWVGHRARRVRARAAALPRRARAVSRLSRGRSRGGAGRSPRRAWPASPRGSRVADGPAPSLR